MAATPGQPPGPVIGPSIPGPSMITQQPVSLPSSVQRIEVPMNPVNVPGTTMVRVSQPAGQIGQANQNVVSRPQIITSTPGGIFPAGVGNLQSLGLMVTRFPSGDHTRPQIILQSRTAPGVGRPVVVTSTAGGQIVQQSPLNRGAVGPGIRTAIVHSGALPPGTVTMPTHAHIQGPPGHPPSSGTIQVMNLSVNPSTQSGVISGVKNQQAATTFISRTFSNTFDGQTVNFILSDAQRGPIRLSSDLIKTATVAGVGGNKYPRVGVSNVGVSSTAPKILSLGPAVSVSAPMAAGQSAAGHHPTQVTRLNIIHSGTGQPGHPMVVNTSAPGGGGKQGMINIAPVQKNQPQTVILNPATNQIMTGIPKLNQQGVKTTVVAMNQSIFGQQQQQSHHGSNPSTVINATALRGLTSGPGVSIGPTGTIVSHGIVSQHSSQQLHPSVVTISSPTKNSTIGHVQSNVTGSPVKSSQHNPTPPSPRPSILARKRNLDNQSSSQGSVGRSPMKAGLAEGLAAKVEAEITESAVALTAAAHAIPSGLSSGLPGSSSSSQGILSTPTDGSSTPRKKPRKQVLETFNMSTLANMKLLSAAGSSDEGVHCVNPSQLQSKDQNQKKGNDVEVVDEVQATRTIEPVDPLLKKFRPALYQSVIPPWKSLQHHFLRHADVKPRAEKRMTLSELSNEGLQKKNGWKIHHLATQMEEMGEEESKVLDRLKKLLDVLEEKTPVAGTSNGDVTTNGTTSNPLTVGTPEKVIDLVRGNLQRSNIFREQMNESQQLLIKLTNDHREKVGKLTRKNMHKRTCIAK